MVGRKSALFLSALVLAACGGGSGGPPPSPPLVATCDDSVEFCSAIPTSADACTEPQYWPLTETSASRPLSVHYSRLDDADKAREILGLVEDSWTLQVDTLGFTAPLSDQGLCGPDANFDVFIWRGIDGAFVSGVADNLATGFDDYSTFMALDITGQQGGALLDSTVAHEFNHALQAGDDWWEDAQHYESGATFVEAIVLPDQDDYFFTLEDFQNRPGWSLFYNDNFATWYMYGAAMYLHFLHERYFANDVAFYARIWRETRSAPTGNRPDYLDALRTVLLTDRGLQLDESIVEFMQWRWFVGANSDSAHFQLGADWMHQVSKVEIDAATLPATQTLDAMMYGANYIRLTNLAATPVQVNVDLQQSDPEVVWRLSTVDGQDVVANVSIPGSGIIVLVAVVIPANEVWTDTLSFDSRTAMLALTTQ